MAIMQQHPHVILESILRRARFIGTLKLALIAVALLLLVALIVISSTNSGDDRFRLVFTSLEQGEAGAPVMTNPRFRGVDADNNPYDVSAESATQQDDDTVLLHAINATLSLENKNWLNVVAEDGVMKIAQKTLRLEGNTQIFHDAGYEMSTTELTVDMGKGTAFGNKPVKMQGSIGKLHANSFTIADRGKRIHLEGAVKVTLYPKKKP